METISVGLLGKHFLKMVNVIEKVTVITTQLILIMKMAAPFLVIALHCNGLALLLLHGN